MNFSSPCAQCVFHFSVIGPPLSTFNIRYTQGASVPIVRRTRTIGLRNYSQCLLTDHLSFQLHTAVWIRWIHVDRAIPVVYRQPLQFQWLPNTIHLLHIEASCVADKASAFASPVISIRVTYYLPRREWWLS